MNRKTSRWSVMGLTAAMTLAGASSGMAAVLDSSAFTNKYEGDVVPVTDYTQSGAFTTAPSSDGDILSFKAPSGGGFFDETTDWVTNSSNATGWTMEFRLKIGTDTAEGSLGAIQVIMGDGTAGDLFRIKQNATITNATVVIDTNSNTDDFHIYRIAKTAGAGNKERRIWRDGVLLTTTASVTFSSDRLLWGSAGAA